MTTRLILVGGFLGAGKTTLLWEAAQKLAQQGHKVGLITNDQAPDLVDTNLLSRAGVGVSEVSGSCFCCNFNGLLAAMDKLKESFDADILIAEPVGSCTDLSATIIQPLKDKLAGELTISPLTVLADPFKLQDIIAGGTAGLHASAAYIYRKQLEEADLIAISKSDLLPPSELAFLQKDIAKAFPATDLFSISSESGTGLQDWLTAVLARNDAGTKLAEVDYDTYAEGEAVLGWLNTRLTFTDHGDWQVIATSIMAKLQQRLAHQKMAIGHVKLIVENDDESLIINLTGSETKPKVRGSISATTRATLTLNARVETSPQQLEHEVRQIILETTSHLSLSTESWNCLQPGRPDPTHRYEAIVA